MLLALLLAACGGGPGGQPAPRADAVVARPLETFRRIGLLTGPPEFPAVLDLATLAGPRDSTFVIVSMSLPNSALRFERDGSGFAGAYDVEAVFRRDSAVARRFARRERVRVQGFAETGRTDESIVFQQAVLLEPGRYELALRAGAGSSSRGLELVDTLDVPGYGPADTPLAGPLFVYEGSGRTVREALPQVILNPRHTTAYGGADPKIYVEWYGGGAPVPLEVRIVDERNETLDRFTTTIPAADTEVRGSTFDVPIGALPLGRLWVEIVPPGNATRVRAPLLLSISDQWMVADFAEVVQFLYYIALPDEVEALEQGTPQERRERWDAFWRRRDPIPSTPTNEFRDEFFSRVRHATDHFSEPGGMAGWRTDRGEVWVVLGPPDFTQDRYISRNDLLQPDGIEWIYDGVPGGRLSLLFLDRTGFGRYELTPSSEAAFRGVADRLKPR